MRDGTALPKIRVGGGLVSFKWLKDQKMLKEGVTPRCVQPGEVFPDFTETATSEENVPHFSQDGVFIHELRYYRPAAYCVDGELDTEEYQYEEEEEEEEGEELSYLKVMLCEEKGESMGGCKGNEDQSCYHRCESFYCNMIFITFTFFSSSNLTLLFTPGAVTPGSPCMMTCA